ncbi:MAG: HAD family hydrolase [Lentisphaeria bacterium]|nr:HAD family hydrolase [Lentisphaeria bacterium]
MTTFSSTPPRKASLQGRPAVFLDRDGTLIEDDGYLREPEDMRMYDSTVEALRLLRESFLLFIVTNQVGVAKGLLTMEDVHRVNDGLVRRLASEGIEIVEVFVCPHATEDNCPCRKPKPFFLHQAADRYGIDLARSFTVGDHLHDVDFGTNAGAKGIFVLTGHGSHHIDELSADTLVAKDILDAAQMILKD